MTGTEYDAVIVGSGFAGSISANRLALAGLNVLVLERGPWRDSLPVRSMGITERAPFPYGAQFITHLLRNIHYSVGPDDEPEHALDNGVGAFLREAGVDVLQLLQRLRRESENGLTLNEDGLYELFVYPGIFVLAASGVGGGSHTFGGMIVEPLDPAYWQHRHPALNPADVEQYYDKIRADMGAVRLTPDVLAPNMIWSHMAELPGNRCRPADPQPDMAYLFPTREAQAGQLVRGEHGVERCYSAFDSDTILGSPSGAKASVDFVYLAPVLGKGATVLDKCEVTTISRDDGRGYAVHVRDLRRNETEVIRARRVILAAGTMNTLRLLFAGRRAKQGLTPMAALGRTWGGNGDLGGVWIKDAADPSMFRSPVILGRYTVDGAASPFLVLAGTCGLDTLPLPLGVKERLGRMAFIIGMGPDTGEVTARFEAGRVQLAYDQRQHPIFGRIRAGIQALEDDTGMKTIAMRTPPTFHQWGGARLAYNPDDGVVDHNGEVYGNPGLFVADAAALPAAVGTPPALTTAAWAHYVADRLAARLS